MENKTLESPIKAKTPSQILDELDARDKRLARPPFPWLPIVPFLVWLSISYWIPFNINVVLGFLAMAITAVLSRAPWKAYKKELDIVRNEWETLSTSASRIDPPVPRRGMGLREVPPLKKSQQKSSSQ